jgi:hypothetical protein
MYSSTMGVIALHVPGHSTHPVSLGILVVFVLLAALAAVAYFIGRRGSGREQSLQPWFKLGVTILGVIALVGLYWK